MINYIAQIPVKNIPEDSERYIVAKILEGVLYCWGTYDSFKEADTTAKEIDGIVLDIQEDE